MVEINACVLDFICTEENCSDFEGHMRDKLSNLPFQMKMFVSFLNQTISFQPKVLWAEFNIICDLFLSILGAHTIYLKACPIIALDYCEL